MKYGRRPLTAAAILSAAIAGTCTGAQAAPPTTQPQQTDVSQELQMLRARIDQLEKQQQEQQVKQQEAQQQATTSSVMTDAQHHSNLFDETGYIAGYKDGRFFLGSEDGNFMLRPWLHFQFRYIVNDRKNAKPDGDDNVDNGFEVRRARFGLDGNMFSPDFTYFFNWATARASSNIVTSTSTTTVSNSLGGVPILEEAWVKYNFHNTPWYIKAGQIKDPLLHDQVVSSRYQQSAERSLTADTFANGDAFTEAVTVIYDPKNWLRTEAGVNHGMRSANTSFQDTPTNAYDFGVAGRAEFKLFGRWQDYAEMGAFDVKEPLAVGGVGVDSSQHGHSTQTVFVADSSYSSPTGLSLYGAFVDRYTNENFGFQTQSATGASITAPPANVLNTPTNEYSILAQAGFIIDKHFEPYGRYEYIHVAGTPAGSVNYFSDITAGVNYYFVGHRAKLTAQIQYLPKGIPYADTPSDLLLNNGHGEIVGTIQFQMLI
ncbi:MAG TPA: hypothetical protein VK797_12990 [Tepidisphaeraceae bacterium]|nr:hypothetical protein [Tepidisphaeraceae bacterium]